MPDDRDLRPYPGLRRFEQFEAQIFFGRETHTDRLLEILQRERFLAVIGPSGCGKSSLVSAGMLPAIAAGWLGMSGRWRIATLRPGDRPIRNLARALLEPTALGAELADVADDNIEVASRVLPLVHAQLRRGPLGLRDLVRDARRSNTEPRNLLVMVDQFEEIFRFTDRGTAQADEADAFVDLLLQARADAEAQIFVTLTMRTDFLGHCVRFADLPEAINRAQYLTPRLNRPQLAMAIAAPARVCGGDVQPEVVNELINVVSADSDQLPVLQHALARMWEEARQRSAESPLITRDDLGLAGGVEGALDRHAEEVLAELSPAQQALAEQLFRSITGPIQPESGSRDTRRPQSLRQIADAAGVQRWEDFEPIVKAFAHEGVNFLSCSPPLEADTTLDADTKIDITHEALIRKWTRLWKWVEKEAERAAEYARWRDRVGQELLTGADLARALAWEAGSAAWHPTAAWAVRYSKSADAAAEFDHTLEYIGRSRRADEERREAEERRRHRELENEAARLRAERDAAEARANAERARKRLFRSLLAVTGLFLVIFALAAFVSFQQWRAAALALAASRRAQAESRFREAVNRIQRDQRSQALGYLAAAMQVPHFDYPAARLLAATLLLDRTWPIPVGNPMPHDGRIRSVAVSPDGHRLLTAAEDNTAKLWDVRSGAPIGAPMRHDKWVRRAIFSPDGGRVLTASDDGSARLWNGKTGEAWPGAEPMGPGMDSHRDSPVIYSAAFSPDGTRVVTASSDGSARLWDAKTGAPWPDAQPMSHGKDKAIYSAVFSPDPAGTRVVTASSDGTARLWDATMGVPWPSAQPMSHGKDSVIYSAVFSPDPAGTRVVTASSDGTARLWDAHSGQPLDRAKPMHHDRAVVAAVFSPDGTQILTASKDGTARLSNAFSGDSAAVMHHSRPVNAAIFSPDGKRIATASDDGTGRVWDASDGHALTEPMPHAEAVFAVAFSPNGVATASFDRTARLWDVRPGAAVAEPHRVAGVFAAAFSPLETDSQILTVSTNGVRLLNGDSITPIAGPTDDGDTMLSAAFNHDASRILIVSENTVRLWNAHSAALDDLVRGAKTIRFAAFSPDGSRVVTVSDQSIQLWDTSSRTPVAKLRDTRATAPITVSSDCDVCADISSDGTRLVVASGEFATLWDAHSGEPLPGAKPMQHNGEVLSVSFSRDATHIVTASRDKTAQVWNGHSGAPLGKLLGHVRTVNTAVFSPDGRRIVTGSDDQTARLWDVPSGSPCGAPMRHELAVNTVRFGRPSDETYQDALIVTASDDGKARLWDGNTGAPLAEPLSHGGNVHMAVFNPDAARILTAAADGKIRIYTLPRTTAADQAALARMALTVGGLTAERIAAESHVCEEDEAAPQPAPQAAAESPALARLTQWFFADRATRTISPFSAMTVDEYRRLDDD